MTLLNENSIISYKSKDGNVCFDVPLDKETVWLTQTQLSNLFDRDQSVISRHINNVFEESEVDKKTNMQKMHIANSDKPVAYYSLDVIISVGYRVKSQRGVEFRQWASKIIKDYLLNGYSLNLKKFSELEKSIEKINLYIQNRGPIDKEVIWTLKYLMEKLDPETSYFPKK